MVVAKRLLFSLKVSQNISKYHQHRTNVVREILATEETYVGDLETVVKSYLHPMRKQFLMESGAGQALVKKVSGILITPMDVGNIFLNIEEICERHRAFLANLRQIVEGWHETTLIGPLFLDMVCLSPRNYFFTTNSLFL